MDKDITSEKELREILAPSLSDMRKRVGLRRECGILEDHDFFDNGYTEMMEKRKMKIINLIDEDFVQYKKPSMFIGMPTCSFKCDKECGEPVCQNSALAAAPKIEMDALEIALRFYNNPISEAVVFGGLEPFDSFEQMCEMISMLWTLWNCSFDIKEMPDIVIYTGYYPDEIKDMLETLKTYEHTNIIIKFGRFIPNRPHRFDEVLGVELASNNQFAINITDIEANNARDLWDKMVAIQKEHLSLSEIETKSEEWYKSYGEQRDI